jgi:lysophospholipase L1-like esterase
VKFIHFTVPLTSQQTGPKALVKKILGKSLRGFDDNIVRNQYNALLRAEYQGKEPILDIATIESTYADGKRASFTREKQEYYTLVEDYTDDGAHLNETGRRVVAEQFLIIMAHIVMEEDGI